jgi:hypothetical protein
VSIDLRIAPFLAAWFLLCGPTAGLAWAPDGHRITGEIAWRNLTPRARDAVRALLPDHPRETLAEAAAWADTYARAHPDEYRWLDPLHYVDADPRAAHVSAGRDCGCVVGAIEIQADRLRDPKAPRAAKLEALRLVAHFVGDVHQPLHVAHPDMRGGNSIGLRFDGRETTLHRLWDGDLLKRRLHELGRRRGPRWQAYAQSLADRAPAAERARWAATTDPNAWADESLVLSQQFTYGVREGAQLGDAYYGEAMPVVEQRLAQSGVRLAALLNAIFDPAAQVP